MRPKKKMYYYEAPKKPEEGSFKYRFEVLEAVGDRYHYFPNEEDDGRIADEEENWPENTGNLPERQSISFKEIQDLIKKKNLNPEDIFFTVSLADDYINLEIVYRHKMDYAAQLIQYNKKFAEWQQQEKQKLEHEEQFIKNDLERLQKRQEEIKKKKST